MSTDDASAALSEVRYSLLIIGTKGPSGPHFMIANWGVQASFDPWRYVLALKEESHTLGYARKAKAFTVNLLRAGDEKLAKDVLKKKGEGFAAVDGPAGAPRLDGAYAGWDCRLVKVVDSGGDHVLVVADVVDGWKRGKGPALTLPDLKLSYAG